MSSICLCMIVRDEVGQLPALLASVRPHVTHWAICDTGSTDGTPELIRRELADLPGELRQDLWVDFATNRTLSLRLAEAQGADYLLILDADTTLRVRPGALGGLTADAYMLRHRDADTEYVTKRLVRSSLNWRYVGAVHEYIESAAECTCETLDGVLIASHSVGALRSGRFERDRALLERSLAAEPGNERDTFYLAQTCRDLGDLDAAIRYYDRRGEMGGWEEEVFYARYEAARLRAVQGEWPVALAGLIGAWEFRPTRLEPLYELASRLRLRGDYHAAAAFAVQGLDRPVPDDALFVAPWIWRYGMLVEYSISAFWVGEIGACAAACEALLAMPDLPEAYRRSTTQNLKLCRTRQRGK